MSKSNTSKEGKSKDRRKSVKRTQQTEKALHPIDEALLKLNNNGFSDVDSGISSMVSGNCERTERQQWRTPPDGDDRSWIQDEEEDVFSIIDKQNDEILSSCSSGEESVFLNRRRQITNLQRQGHRKKNSSRRHENRKIEGKEEFVTDQCECSQLPSTSSEEKQRCVHCLVVRASGSTIDEISNVQISQLQQHLTSQLEIHDHRRRSSNLQVKIKLPGKRHAVIHQCVGKRRMTFKDFLLLAQLQSSSFEYYFRTTSDVWIRVEKHEEYLPLDVKGRVYARVRKCHD